MSEQKSHKYSAVELADTGRWHLVVLISATGVAAWLKYLGDSSSPIELFNVKFDTGGNPLAMLEDAVFDNPRVLDDFSADIIVDTSRSAWLPTSIAELPGENRRLFEALWPEAIQDILVDSAGEETCLFTLMSGLRNFLSRTFPGTKVRSHLSALRSVLFPDKSSCPLALVDLRPDGICDMIAVGNEGLLFAVSRPYDTYLETASFLTNALLLSGGDPEATITTVIPSTPDAFSLAQILTSRCARVEISDIAASCGAPGLPLVAAVMATRRTPSPASE